VLNHCNTALSDGLVQQGSIEEYDHLYSRTNPVYFSKICRLMLREEIAVYYETQEKYFLWAMYRVNGHSSRWCGFVRVYTLELPLLLRRHNLKEGVSLIHMNEYSVAYKIYECSEIDFTVTKLLNFLLARLSYKVYE
jgi:hypothetical protein